MSRCPQEFGALRRGWSIPWLVRGWFAHAIDSVAGCESAIVLNAPDALVNATRHVSSLESAFV